MTLLSKICDDRLDKYQDGIVYMYTNGSIEYRTISLSILPKIVGTTYKHMVKIIKKNGIIISASYIKAIELAKAQGYDINLKDEPYIYKIIGCSIPSPIIEREVLYFITRFNNIKPKIGVIGGYGLEGLAIGRTNGEHVFTQITNHTDNKYLKNSQIKKNY